MGPVTPLVALAKGESPSAELSAMLSMMGGFLIILGCMLFTVRWNVINGKMSGLACIGCAYNIFSVFKIQADVEAIIVRQKQSAAASPHRLTQTRLTDLGCSRHRPPRRRRPPSRSRRSLRWSCSSVACT